MDARLITIKPQVSAVMITRMMLDTTFTCGVFFGADRRTEAQLAAIARDRAESRYAVTALANKLELDRLRAKAAGPAPPPNPAPAPGTAKGGRTITRPTVRKVLSLRDHMRAMKRGKYRIGPKKDQKGPSNHLT